MRKFSDLNNGNKIEKIKTKRELLESIVNDTLISSSDIQGKAELVDTIYKMMEMSEHKTRITVLESIKNVAYKGLLDFNWINESIDSETFKMNNVTVDVVEEVITENVAWWLPEVLNGIGMISAIGGLGGLLIALQDGKLGAAGKKFADSLSDIKDIAKSVKSGKLDSDVYDKVYKEGDKKEDILKPTLKDIVELNSGENKEVLDALEKGELGETGIELVKKLSEINDTSEKVLEEEKNK